MPKQNYITSYCTIRSGTVSINGVIDYSEKQPVSAHEFLISVYKHYQFAYLKFYKMDDLCKLAILTSELLLKSNKITDRYSKEDIAIVIANNASSLEIDTA